MKEIEGKILEIDLATEIAKLEKLGATKIADHELVAEFFVDSRGESVRLRKEGEITFLTRKDNIGSLDGIKIADEEETSVGSPESMRAILRSLGYSRVRTVTKRRISFILGDAKVELDDYRDIPPLLEIEGKTSDIVRKTAVLLGFDPDTLVIDSVRDLEKRYNVALGTKG